MNHLLVVTMKRNSQCSGRNPCEEGYGVATAARRPRPWFFCRTLTTDAVLLDIWLPDRDGLYVLSDIHGLATEIRPEVVIISGHGTLRLPSSTSWARTIFLEKPLSLDRTHLVLKNAGGSAPPCAQKTRVQAPIQSGLCAHRRKRSLKALRQQIRLMAPTNGRCSSR